MSPPTELISAQAIASRVAALGKQIDQEMPAGPLTVVGVLRGAFVFMADLVRVIPRSMTCDFLGVRSYGDATVSSGVVEITSDLGTTITDRHVLLIEDIADTGLTLKYLLDVLSARGPATLRTCALLSKPSRRTDRRPRGLRRLRNPRRVRGRATAWTPASCTATSPTSACRKTGVDRGTVLLTKPITTS